MTTTRVPLQHCPECNTKLDAASSLREGLTPKAGDFTVCIACSVILVYEPGLIVRLAGKDELRKLDAETLFDLVRTQTAIREMHRQRRQRQRDNWANN